MRLVIAIQCIFIVIMALLNMHQGTLLDQSRQRESEWNALVDHCTDRLLQSTDELRQANEALERGNRLLLRAHETIVRLGGQIKIDCSNGCS